MVLHADLSAVIGSALPHIAEQSAAAAEARVTIGWSGTPPGGRANPRSRARRRASPAYAARLTSPARRLRVGRPARPTDLQLNSG
jgi:hypothetical protein